MELHNKNKNKYIYKSIEKKGATTQIVGKILDDPMFKATLKLNELVRGTAL